HVGERSQGPPACPRTERGAAQGGERRRAEQREAERLEGALQVVELDQLEVLRARRWQRDANGERGLALQVEHHPRWPAAVDGVAKRGGDGVLTDLRGEAEPPSGEVQHRPCAVGHL